MPTFDRRNRRDLDQLVEEYITTNNINRRQFLQRATAAGLSISGASALLAACGGSPTPSGGPTKVTSIDALGVWSGAELDNFNAINTAFTQKYGIKVNVETSRDLPTILNTRVRGNNPPDVSGVPSIATFHKLASQGKLLQLDKFFDMSSIQQNYAQAWINLASDNGHLYAVTPTANTKGTIWYSPKQFTTNGYTVPKTWNDLIALSDKIADRPDLSRHQWPRHVCQVGRPPDPLDGPQHQKCLPDVRPGRHRQALHQWRAAVHPGHQLPACLLPAI